MPFAPPAPAAPEIARPGLEWLNASTPLSLAALRGKLVLLDFWTFCCINCIQSLPALQKVEETFSEEAVVIGVHSPKFAAEKDARNLRAAVARYGIRHPVIHDPELILWRAYAVHAWPTLVFVGPDGTVLGVTSGEPEALDLLNTVREILENHDGKDVLKPSPLSRAAARPASAGLLSFPGKIKLLPGGEKIWAVADSGHHQIALFDDGGNPLRRYGSGGKGRGDGAASVARFNAPQGLAADHRFIYVADTGNHAIRRIDRASGEVSTLAGTGGRGMLLLNRFEKAGERALASPWDLALRDNILFFANAGTHQIGAVDLDTGLLRVIAGSGDENIVDGPVLRAALAQPSGLAFNADFSRLYFADSETSALRYVDMKAGEVRTLAGTGLFDFGHHNGPLKKSLFQHPLGLAVVNEKHLAVADSYNGALRLVDLEKEETADLDEGFSCAGAVCLPYGEPAGVWADGENRLLVSDTNNHRIAEIDRAARTVRTWTQ